MEVAASGRVNIPFKLPFSLMRNKSLFPVINSTSHSEEGPHGPRNFALATWRANPGVSFADPSVLALKQQTSSVLLIVIAERSDNISAELKRE
jgi:hypothetical protein